MPYDRPTGWLQEIFPSIQGEGLYCGQRQTFVRFAGCNLACAYCDTPQSRESKPGGVRLSEPPHPNPLPPLGEREYSTIVNPVDVDTVADICERLGRRVVSLTGGEPLLQVDYLGALMDALSGRGMFNYLETNGTLYEGLSLVIRHADCIAMDIKLPSATGQPAQWDSHAKFLEIASGTEVFVKAVVASNTPESEIMQCMELIAAVDNKTPLVIQPAFGCAPSGEQLMRFQEIASAKLEDVRVIPQCHKFLGLQ